MTDIKILDNGPLVVNGASITDGEGKELETKEKVFLCRCGLSGNKPFCDGSHKDTFESEVRA